MASEGRSRADQIRALIEEVDRIRSESERVRSHAERAMKQSFWPERRRNIRLPDSGPHERGRDDAT
jgi:hypothetical protein